MEGYGTFQKPLVYGYRFATARLLAPPTRPETASQVQEAYPDPHGFQSPLLPLTP